MLRHQQQPASPPSRGNSNLPNRILWSLANNLSKEQSSLGHKELFPRRPQNESIFIEPLIKRPRLSNQSKVLFICLVVEGLKAECLLEK